MMPGNPIQTLIGKITNTVTPEEIRAIRLSFGLGFHQGLVAQYFTYLTQTRPRQPRHINHPRGAGEFNSARSSPLDGGAHWAFDHI